MDYEKKYKQLHTLIGDLYPFMSKYCKEKVEGFFPELKESEDERIRKAIIGYIDHGQHYGVSNKEMLAWLEKQGEQNPAWSEEDEVKMNRIVACLENLSVADYDILLKDVDWLKSLKDRVDCEVNCTTTKEWSVEDKSKVQRICQYLNEAKKYYADITEVRECIDWLKSLEPQSIWKPSEEQIKVCKKVYADLLSAKGFDLGTVNSELNRLEEQLKKLWGK